MNLQSFVEINSLRPGDAVILGKKFLGLFDHYVIYLGKSAGKPEFIANYNEGIKIVPEDDISRFLTVLEPKSIERMNGDFLDRTKAIERAKSRIGEKSYGLVSHNCEHFKNWVQKGIVYSLQVENFGNISLAAGTTLAVTGIASKNKLVTTLGILALLAGAFAKYHESQKDKE